MKYNQTPFPLPGTRKKKRSNILPNSLFLRVCYCFDINSNLEKEAYSLSILIYFLFNFIFILLISSSLFWIKKDIYVKFFLYHTKKSIYICSWETYCTLFDLHTQMESNRKNKRYCTGSLRVRVLNMMNDCTDLHMSLPLGTS